MGLIAGLVVLLLAVFASTVLGSRSISLADTVQALWMPDLQSNEHLIIRELRVPRTIIAIMVGLALGVAGAVMQAVTRNPLAEPGLLGINAGAAVAVILGIVAFNLTSVSQYVWFAFAGAGLAGVAVFFLGQERRAGTNPVRLVLAGAGISVVLASVAGILIINAPTSVLDQFRHWSAGSVEGRGYDVIAVLVVSIAAGLIAAFSIAGRLNALALGKELAAALGVDVYRTVPFLPVCHASCWRCNSGCRADRICGIGGSTSRPDCGWAELSLDFTVFSAVRSHSIARRRYYRARDRSTFRGCGGHRFDAARWTILHFRCSQIPAVKTMSAQRRSVLRFGSFSIQWRMRTLLFVFC